jgi:hypothetical protein
MQKEYVTSTNYDLGRGEVTRMLVLTLYARCIPLGQLGGGPQLRSLLVLLLSHTLGRFLFPCLIPFEQQVHHLYQRLRRKRP